MNTLTASDIALYYRPSKCWRRLDCRRLGLPQAKPNPYAEVLRDLGLRHEKAHLRTLEPVFDLSSGTMTERIEATKRLLREGTARIYQPVLTADAPFDTQALILGIPDFLIRETDGYVVRDCKISRRITAKDHPEILEQLDLYGWLVEANTGRAPVRLEVIAGDGEVVGVHYARAHAAFETLLRALQTMEHGLDDYEPVGWSKCLDCAYRQHCWDRAVETKDPSVVYDVDQGTARALHEMGITDYGQLPGRLTSNVLAEMRKPRGKQMVRVGPKAATSILAHAEALAGERLTILRKPNVPASDNFVMFDLEGLPPQMDDSEKIYLWGMQVFGKNASPCIQAVADFGQEGDLNGWRDFLTKAAAIFGQFGDIPFVHWYRYEKDKLAAYTERYGDPDGVAARVDRNLCDLLIVTQDSVVLPTYSYSIKQVERFASYTRTLEEYGGNWSMAQYIKAVETEDAELRRNTMEQIKTYNREDLEATWAMMQWLKSL
jgi:predicted RecB family nuclease